MKPSVTNSIVGHDFCIGCGLCAALCPQDVLTMQWNRYGEYNPVEMTPCTTECGLCLKVCPFATSEENEDTIGERLYGAVPGIRHRSETGYYLAAYVGYSERHRPTSASGGMATWLLETLLTQGVVDHVICVAPTGDPERLFAFRVFDTPEDVRTGAGSAYYPVEMSGVIRQVLEVPGRYAVTGLPCFLKAIRLAGQRNKKLRERIVVTVGLVCGQLKSKHFTDYVAALAGVRGEVAGVRYRGKSPDHPASNLSLHVHDRGRRGAQDPLDRRDRRGLDEPVVHAGGLQLLRRRLCRVCGRHLHGCLATGVFAGQSGDESCAGAVAGGAGGARAGAGSPSRPDPGRAGGAEPGRGRGD